MIMLALCLAGCERRPAEGGDRADEFLRLMSAGKNYLDQGDATNALVVYRRAQAIFPNDAGLHLNLANAHLAAGAAGDAVREADEVLKIEPNSAAAYFVKGSAHLRLSNWEEAVRALENSKKIDPGEPATRFQLGMARMGLKQWDAAIADFTEGLGMDPNRLHTAVRYQLAQALLRAGRQAEAMRELERHQIDASEGQTAGAATFERSKFTQARVPFKLDQPHPQGIPVRFVDGTREAFGADANRFSGPIGVINGNHKGWIGLFLIDKDAGFRVLSNTNGVFRAQQPSFPVLPGVTYSRMLVGDLQNDRFDDVIVLGDKGSHLFRFGTNQAVEDVSRRSRLASLGARDGLLMDLDFTGKLDLLAIDAPAGSLRVFRQFGPLAFGDITSTSGVPASLRSAQGITMEDWGRDGIMDVLVGRNEGAPLLLEKRRGGPLVPSEPANWVGGAVCVAADFDNDLRPDLAIAAGGTITICYNGGNRREMARAAGPLRRLVAVDFDNDGWMDLWGAGETVQAWRNAGASGFQERTAQLGLDRVEGEVTEIQFADFDLDCDSDAVLALAAGGIRYLRNDGGNANAQVKVQMIGNRSNASGLGCKIEIAAGGLRLTRTVHRLPVEVGVGPHRLLDSFLVHWFNWPQGSAELGFNCRDPLFALELTIQEGSCPYVYAWNGKRFEFVTDILGAAPLGLPIAEGRYIESDPEEFVWMGNEQTFPPRDGAYELRITEELREVLYLDEAKLVVVDHEPGTEVHATDKLLPGKPFPKGGIVTVHREQPLRRAEMLDGRDVTGALKAIDGVRASPPRLRAPQLRGLAEPHGVMLDFGDLDVSRPLMLVMNGWLRFGGGMANIASSHDPGLPFPFPTLEAEIAPGVWEVVDVVVGAPAGKTKTIVVNLDGRLKAGTRRLRLQQAFEIHWDRIALLEKKPDARTTVRFVTPSEAELRFRGFSALRPLPPDWPTTPDYENVQPNFYWTITPGGWCTRYGDVSGLVAVRDEGLALINGGDELSLRFTTNAVPSKPAGTIRNFFLYVDGWDKDSDFHVARGTEVGPLPFHGMDDQAYGRQVRPSFPSDTLHRKFNTRWVEGRVLKRVDG